MIVTGMEHSGTTYLTQLVKSHFTEFESGFECGVLLSDYSPKNFHKVLPFYDWLCKPIEEGHWGLTSEDRTFTCDTDDFAIFYERLVDTCIRFTQTKPLLLDKTPKYSYELTRVHNNFNEAPIVLIERDIIPLWSSYKKRGVELNDFISRYAAYRSSITKAHAANCSFLKITHKETCLDVEGTVSKISEHIRLPCPTKKQLIIERNLPVHTAFDFRRNEAAAMDSSTEFEIVTLNRLENDLRIVGVP